ncbi:hypothetical protein PVAP13_3KG347527 [Panicum virgatum]|uniref:Uncharacterized protein n=1 Tax=Panicum virgatum TaxID=38727 RepID=A0A8T0UQB5_PANVG|nr:hypothetical protein PVAP13_3KG347527 [Panicum virgatum]
MLNDSLDRSYLLPNHTSLLPTCTRSIAVLKIYMLLFEQQPKIDKTHANLASSILMSAASPYMHGSSKRLNYRGGSLYRRDENSLMTLHRHVSHHCMEHWTLSSPCGAYTYEAVQNLLEHTFPEFIPRLQFGWLKPLKLHKLFTSSSEPYDD